MHDDAAILVVLAGLTLAGMHFFLRRVTS